MQEQMVGRKVTDFHSVLLYFLRKKNLTQSLCVGSLLGKQEGAGESKIRQKEEYCECGLTS